MKTIRQYTNNLYEIEVQHPWTQERRFLPIETVTKNGVSVRWGQSGIYDIFLTGDIVARSLKTRLRAPCIWKAVDVEELKAFVHEKMNPGIKAENENRYDAHTKSMPYTK